MRTATLPAVRVSPETRSLVESVLKEGETLSTFIEETVRNQAQWRKEDQAFYAEALRRSALVKSGKMKTVSHEEVIQGLRDRLARKKQEKSLKKAA
jgi:hypothetical protein